MNINWIFRSSLKNYDNMPCLQQGAEGLTKLWNICGHLYLGKESCRFSLLVDLQVHCIEYMQIWALLTRSHCWGPYIQVTIKAHGPLVKTHINFDAWDHSILQWQKLDVSILYHLLLMNTIISQWLCYLRKWIYTLCRSLDYFCFALEIDIYTTDNARFKFCHWWNINIVSIILLP